MTSIHKPTLILKTCRKGIDLKPVVQILRRYAQNDRKPTVIQESLTITNRHAEQRNKMECDSASVAI